MVGPGRRTSARRAFCSRSRSINGEESIADEQLATLLACQYTGMPSYRQDRSSVDLLARGRIRSRAASSDDLRNTPPSRGAHRHRGGHSSGISIKSRTCEIQIMPPLPILTVCTVMQRIAAAASPPLRSLRPVRPLSPIGPLASVAASALPSVTHGDGQGLPRGHASGLAKLFPSQQLPQTTLLHCVGVDSQ